MSCLHKSIYMTSNRWMHSEMMHLSLRHGIILFNPKQMFCNFYAFDGISTDHFNLCHIIHIANVHITYILTMQEHHLP